MAVFVLKNIRLHKIKERNTGDFRIVVIRMIEKYR